MTTVSTTTTNTTAPTVLPISTESDAFVESVTATSASVSDSTVIEVTSILNYYYACYNNIIVQATPTIIINNYDCGNRWI